jgi:hypothetical protein
MNNKNYKVVLYTGVGSNNGGKHSKKRFMEIAKKEFGKACSTKLGEKNCNPCKKLKKLEYEIMDDEFEAMDRGKKYKVSKNKSKRRSNLKKKCKKCTKKKGKKCNFEELLEYSGAELNN